MSLLDEFGQTVKARRRSLGVNQRELAAKADVSVTTLNALENERLRELGVGKLAAIFRALDLELAVRAKRAARPTLDELREEENAESLD